MSISWAGSLLYVVRYWVRCENKIKVCAFEKLISSPDILFNSTLDTRCILDNIELFDSKKWYKQCRLLFHVINEKWPYMHCTKRVWRKIVFQISYCVISVSFSNTLLPLPKSTIEKRHMVRQSCSQKAMNNLIYWYLKINLVPEKLLLRYQ